MVNFPRFLNFDLWCSNRGLARDHFPSYVATIGSLTTTVQALVGFQSRLQSIIFSGEREVVVKELFTDGKIKL